MANEAISAIHEITRTVRNIEEASSAVAEATGSASAVASAASELSRQSEHLRAEVDTFIGRLSAEG